MNYERGLRDSSEFYEWQVDVRAEDDLEEKLRVEASKIEMQLSHEKAHEAKELQLKKNKLNVETVKLEGKIMEKRKQIEKVGGSCPRPRGIMKQDVV